MAKKKAGRAEAQPPQGTVTILFTDIVNSTEIRNDYVQKHGELDGDALYRRKILQTHDRRIRECLEAFGGFEVKTLGDSFMVSFATAGRAIEFACALQKSLGEKPIEAGQKTLQIRIGAHTGQPQLVETADGHDYDGEAVNIAARIAALSGAGEVLCSPTTQKLCEKLPSTRFQLRGSYELKGIADPVEVYEVVREIGSPAYPPGRKGLAPQRALLAAGLAFLVGTFSWWTELFDQLPRYQGARQVLAKWWAGPAGGKFAANQLALIVADTEGTPPSIEERRGQHAELLDCLSEAGARVVVFDYFFEPHYRDADEAFAAAIRKAGEDGTSVVVGLQHPPAGRGWELDMSPTLLEAGVDWGLIRLEPDLRNHPLLHVPLGNFAYGQSPERVDPVHLWPSLALQAWMAYQGAEQARFSSASAEIQLLGPDRAVLTRIKSKPDLRLTTLATTSNQREPYWFTYEEILEKECGKEDRSYLSRKFGEPPRIVLIGSASEKLHGPGPGDYGHEIHAHVISSLLLNRYWKPPATEASLGVFFFLALLGVAWRRMDTRTPGRIGRAATWRARIAPVFWLLAGISVTTATLLVAALVLFKTSLLVLPVVYYLATPLTAYLLASLLDRRKGPSAP